MKDKLCYCFDIEADVYRTALRADNADRSKILSFNEQNQASAPVNSETRQDNAV